MRKQPGKNKETTGNNKKQKPKKVKFSNNLKYKKTRLIHISTDEVYGTLAEDDEPFTEETHIAPNSPYAASKASADMLCRSFYETYQYPITITRCSNNYGPNQFPEKLLPLFINNIRNNKSLPVYGDGLFTRDWLYVVDHARAIDIIYELEPVKRGIYAGAIGYLGWNGNMDTAIAIRTCVIKNDKLYIQCGAGIVNDSVAELEWEETINKGKAVLQAYKNLRKKNI